VLLWTVTADKSWSDWPTEPSYVLAMRETAKAVARTDSGTHELTAGEVLRCPVSGERRIISPVLEVPGGDEPRPLTIESVEPRPTAMTGPENAEQLQKNLVWNETGRAGLYRLNWQESPGGAASDVFAVNPDARESELARIPVDELRQRWHGAQPEIIVAFSTADASVGVRGQEIWRSLAYCLLAMMGFEACFATYVGRQR
jgi:hypothetical protein